MLVCTVCLSVCVCWQVQYTQFPSLFVSQFLEISTTENNIFPSEESWLPLKLFHIHPPRETAMPEQLSVPHSRNRQGLRQCPSCPEQPVKWQLSRAGVGAPPRNPPIGRAKPPRAVHVVPPTLPAGVATDCASVSHPRPCGPSTAERHCASLAPPRRAGRPPWPPFRPPPPSPLPCPRTPGRQPPAGDARTAATCWPTSTSCSSARPPRSHGRDGRGLHVPLAGTPCGWAPLHSRLLVNLLLFQSALAACLVRI